MKRRPTSVAGALVLVLGSILGCTDDASSSAPEDVFSGVAVVSERRPSPSVVAGGHVDADGITTFGVVRISNPGAEDMELVGVRVNATPGVEVLDVVAVPADPPIGSWDGGPGPPSPEVVGEDAGSVGEVLSGDVFATAGDPTPELQVLLVLQAPASELHAVNGIDVSYRVGRYEREATFPFGSLFCMESPACAAALDRDTDAVLFELGLLQDQTRSGTS